MRRTSVDVGTFLAHAADVVDIASGEAEAHALMSTGAHKQKYLRCRTRCRRRRRRCRLRSPPAGYTNDADVMDAEPEPVDVDVDVDRMGPETHSWWGHAM